MAYRSNDIQVEIGKIKTSEYNELRISTISDSVGLKAIDIRNWFCTSADQEMKPTQKGVRIKQEDLAEVLDLIVKNAGSDVQEDLRTRGYDFE